MSRSPDAAPPTPASGAELVRRFAPDRDGGLSWSGVERLRYKEDGSAPFKDITRQVLFAQPDQDCELRYFEIAAGGYSTLERHRHTHAVLILRGRGTVQLGESVHAIGEHDLVTVEPLTWHQFRADAGCALGFLCLVSRERDRPQLPPAGESGQT
jgi:quercetin dioxygenase-like cupin family protein